MDKHARFEHLRSAIADFAATSFLECPLPLSMA